MRGESIIIGVKDNGVVVGVDKVDEVFRKISDNITTQIEPNPQDEISSELKFDEGKTLIVIHIQFFVLEEVSFEEAHQVGIKLCEKILGGKYEYEYVLATHINKDPYP